MPAGFDLSSPVVPGTDCWSLGSVSLFHILTTVVVMTPLAAFVRALTRVSSKGSQWRRHVQRMVATHQVCVILVPDSSYDKNICLPIRILPQTLRDGYAFVKNRDRVYNTHTQKWPLLILGLFMVDILFLVLERRRIIHSGVVCTMPWKHLKQSRGLFLPFVCESINVQWWSHGE